MKRLADGVLVLVAVAFLAPLAWLGLAALDPAATAQTQVPASLTLDNLGAVLTPDLTLRPLFNSLLLSGGAAIVTVVAAVLAAYPLSRYRMRITRPFLYTVLFGTCLPVTAIMVPVYSLAVRAGVLDSLVATSLFLAASSLPMAIWMCKNFMDAVPVGLGGGRPRRRGVAADGPAPDRRAADDARPGCGVHVRLRAGVRQLLRAVRAAALPRQAARGRHDLHVLRAVRHRRLRAARGVLLYSAPVIALYVLVARGLGGSHLLAGAVRG